MASSRVSEVNQLTDSQIERLQNEFYFFDMDDDGKISTRELGFVMRAFGLDPSETDLCDEDDLVDFPQFLRIVKRKMNCLKFEKELFDAFLVYDSDRSGYVTKAELKSVLESLGKNTSEEYVNTIAEAADCDASGRLCYESIIELLLEM